MTEETTMEFYIDGNNVLRRTRSMLNGFDADEGTVTSISLNVTIEDELPEQQTELETREVAELEQAEPQEAEYEGADTQVAEGSTDGGTVVMEGEELVPMKPETVEFDEQTGTGFIKPDTRRARAIQAIDEAEDPVVTSTYVKEQLGEDDVTGLLKSMFDEGYLRRYKRHNWDGYAQDGAKFKYHVSEAGWEALEKGQQMAE